MACCISIGVLNLLLMPSICFKEGGVFLPSNALVALFKLSLFESASLNQENGAGGSFGSTFRLTEVNALLKSDGLLGIPAGFFSRFNWCMAIYCSSVVGKPPFAISLRVSSNKSGLSLTA